ncbi:hypothetical protein J7W19_27585 [Streptomyces mobaraensis NBRC 13819 = DSM 40847]|uniref:Uncharacterized protein n=1 Tax=Streptomyces mobaraensis (strain ATCC 29032 / DSM 40847 / JCM 4168 / NBRC 13819 / NCIMB 11159 / IPCR 16-22) TaxID=1223523 RepID=M3CAX3_STRM1|nr:hypothetical protein [Streptomyces mobaraensis]EMF01212.1 hypothetical protein H340_07146 [Streptomyces mobaraensis NBRC 13819 = DSM 40847]QTT76642.1 hypothetical protein J7W19_27585 [Streptomyces mobaraensis NBRC 13819 = DSM 40847]
MTVLPLIHIRRRDPGAVHCRTASARAFLRRTARRVADGAVDTPVLRALGAPARPGTTAEGAAPTRPRAHWRAVTGPDGRRRLEADWRAEP